MPNLNTGFSPYRMIGGYTATVTAVLVVNGDRLPFVVPEFLCGLAPLNINLVSTGLGNENNSL